jgi:hypothetical protein
LPLAKATYGGRIYLSASPAHKNLPIGKKNRSFTNSTLCCSKPNFSTNGRAKLVRSIEVCDAFSEISSAENSTKIEIFNKIYFLQSG